MQTSGEVAPTIEEYVFLEQREQVDEVDEVYLPAPQSVHIDEPFPAAYPGAHGVHTLEVLAPVSGLNLPSAHATQALTCIPYPTSCTLDP